MPAEELPAQQELPRQRLGSGHVAVGLDPHAASHFPTTFGHACPNSFKDARMILNDVLVNLGLALEKAKVRELFHQPQDTAERARSLAARLAERPQPGHVQMGMAHSNDIHRQGGAGRCQALIESLLCRRDTLVETVSERLALSMIERLTEDQAAECLIQGTQQAHSGGIVLVQFPEYAQSHAGCGHKIASGLVDLHDFRLAHHDRLLARSDPTMQGQHMRSTIVP